MSAKINDTPIKIKSIVPRVSKKLSVQRPPGQNSDAIEGLGSQGAELQISLQADTLAKKHLWAAEFLKTGPQVLEDPDGYIYNIVESQATGGRNYEGEPNLDQRWLFGFSCLMEEPYKFLSVETTRLKTITTNGQEWSADDSANDITTAGTIDVIPDIEVVAGALGSGWVEDGATFTKSFSGPVSLNSQTFQLYRTETFSAVGGKKWALLTWEFDYDGTNTDEYYEIRTWTSAGGEVTRAAVGPIQYDGTLSGDFSGYIANENETVEVRYYARYDDSTAIPLILSNFETVGQYKNQAVTKDLTIYNTADTTRKVQVCNEIPPGTTVNINKNGTGSLNYPDDFTTDQYKYVSYDYNNITYDDPNDRITLAGADGYLVYPVDCKFPITGIPTLALNVHSGVVKIAIAENVAGAPGTYYDIDDLTTTNYSSESITFLLDNLVNYRLKGETSFFLKIYTDGITDLVLNSLEFNTDLVTIDTLLPYVYLGGPNTFRADQNSDSSLNATVTLTYRDGDWAI